MPKYVPREQGPQNRPPKRDLNRGKLSGKTMQQLRRFSIAERKAGRKPILYIPENIMVGMSKKDRDFIYGY